jgi:AcrR family transcriptional regulator
VAGSGSRGARPVRAARGSRPHSTRPGLTRDAIWRTALAIADRDGLSGLTIRKIAAELGVSAMAVYRHFGSKLEIVDGLVDLVVADSDVTAHRAEDWRAWVRQTFTKMRRALLEHPGIMPLLGAAAFSGVEAGAVAARVITELREAGCGETSADLFHTLMSYTVGTVALESSAAAGDERFVAGIDRILASVRTASTPGIADARRPEG